MIALYGCYPISRALKYRQLLRFKSNTPRQLTSG